MSRALKSKKQTPVVAEVVVVAEPVPVVLEPVPVVLEPAPVAEVDLDEDEEERRLLAELKANRAKKALREATADIQKHRDRAKAEIQQLIDANLRKIKELQEANDQHKEEQNNIDKGFKDSVFTSSIVRQAEQIQVSTIAPVRAERPQRAEGEKRVRKVVSRPKLFDIIESRLNFRWAGHTCYTDNGKEFHEEDGNVLRSLNAWTESIIERGGGGGRKVSVYEVVEVQNIETGKWKNWGEVYSEDCIKLEF